MDIKELDKKQLILLTLLITFVVSIATGIVTVSLMNQMPKSVPQTINNVIQKTIERVTTIEAPARNVENNSIEAKDNSSFFVGNSEALISIYKIDTNISIASDTNLDTDKVDTGAIGQGIIISEEGLILVDSNILTEDNTYRVILDKINFDASILKKFTNGFTILKISSVTEKKIEDISNTENSDKVE